MWRHARLAQQRQAEQEKRQAASSSTRGRPMTQRGRGRGGGGEGRGRGHRGGGFSPRGRADFRGRGGGGGGRGSGGHPPSAPPPRPQEIDGVALPQGPRPWCNYRLQTETWLRDTLQKKATESKQAEDHDRFRRQRAKVHDLEAELMAEYFKSHPSQEGFWLPLLAMEAARTAHFCDVCEVEFAREGELIRHEESHVVCDLDGCTFVACQEILEEHVLLLHASGLYARMKRGYGKEEVDNWKNERRSNYPTMSVIAVKEAKKAVKKQQMYMREARLYEERREWKEAAAERRRREAAKRQARAAAQAQFREEEARRRREREGASRDSSEVEREAGSASSSKSRSQKLRERRKNRMIEKNTAGISVNRAEAVKVEIQHHQESKRRAYSDFSDESDPEDCCQGVRAFSGVRTEEKEPEDQGRRESLDDSEASRSAAEDTMDITMDSDDEPPEELSFQSPKQEDRSDVLEASASSPSPAAPPPPPRPTSGDEEFSSPQRWRKPPPPSKQRPQRGHPTFFSVEEGEHPIRIMRRQRERRATLLERLLDKEVKEERSELLQCVKYICERNFFDDGDGKS